FLGDNHSEGLFHKISAVIQSALEENFSDLDVEIIAEPGTYFTCSAVTLTTAICGKKKRNDQRNTMNGINPIQRFYYVNDSIYGSFYEGVELYGCSLKPLLSDEEIQRRTSYNSNVWGQTCCAVDLLAKEQQLPELEEGEFIVWENMGAYNQVLCSTFCGVPYPASRHVFINNPRLSLEWLSNVEEVVDFLSETCSLVAKE
ncbi:Ornithine decarboxylase, partial [Araneus ventricosus]